MVQCFCCSSEQSGCTILDRHVLTSARCVRKGGFAEGASLPQSMRLQGLQLYVFFYSAGIGASMKAGSLEGLAVR